MRPEGAMGHMGAHCSVQKLLLGDVACHPRSSLSIFLVPLSQAWHVVDSPGYLSVLSGPSATKGSLNLT